MRYTLKLPVRLNKERYAAALYDIGAYIGLLEPIVA